jgi:hypothetical protein
MQKITASQISQAVKQSCRDGVYTMSLVGEDRELVISAVNQGIDAHLEACFVPDRGDRYQHVGARLECGVSPQSLPVLLRRLCEGPVEAVSLAADILGTLDFFVDTGCFDVVSAVDEADVS